nr:hypothetical protein CFP56_70256 [Quercus suber]
MRSRMWKLSLSTPPLPLPPSPLCDAELSHQPLPWPLSPTIPCALFQPNCDVADTTAEESEEKMIGPSQATLPEKVLKHS